MYEKYNLALERHAWERQISDSNLWYETQRTISQRDMIGDLSYPAERRVIAVEDDFNNL